MYTVHGITCSRYRLFTVSLIQGIVYPGYRLCLVLSIHGIVYIYYHLFAASCMQAIFYESLLHRHCVFKTGSSLSLL